MVISYYGALNAFITLYDLLPKPIYSFVLLCLLLTAGLRVLIKISDI